MITKHKKEIRFDFGKNWMSYVEHIDDERLENAKKSLKEFFGETDFSNKDFLDIGCGSGLFSLAAKQLGAKSVISFDYDKYSVGATQTLKETYYPQDETWHISEGNALDENFIKSLGQFDLVYSWGVLHHTGDIDNALKNILYAVKLDGKMGIAIYNDQGIKSDVWKKIKKLYCINRIGRFSVWLFFVPVFSSVELLKSLFNLRHIFSINKAYNIKRGMSFYHDLIDWLGGYPFEVAKPEKIFHFYKSQGGYFREFIDN